MVIPVQHATQVNVANSAASAFAITLNGTTGGNALVAYLSAWQNLNAVVIDSVTDGGNTFTARSGTAESGVDFGTRVAVAYAVSITGGNRTVSFNCSNVAGSTYYVLGCSEYSAVKDATPEDVWDTNENQNITTNDTNAGPITTTEAGDLLVGCAGLTTVSAALAFASPASWTNRYRQNDGATFIGMDAGEWLPGSIQTTYTPQWAHANAAGELGCGVAVALKPAQAQPPSVSPDYRLFPKPKLRKVA